MASATLTPEAFASTSTICLLVGEEETPLHVSETILRTEPYFDNALRHNFSESQSRTIKLANESPHTVMYFIQWLYNRRLPAAAETDSDSTMMRVVKLMTFADLIVSEEPTGVLKNKMLDELDNWRKRKAVEAELNTFVDAAIYAYNTTPESPVAKFFALMTAIFLKDLYKHLRDLGDGDDPRAAIATRLRGEAAWVFWLKQHGSSDDMDRYLIAWA